MTFLDPKEQVIDIQLTSYGRYTLSLGKFNPTHYAFFDNDIIYDRQFVTGTAPELQNNIEPRIQENTPRLGAQTLYRGAQVGVFSENGEHVNNLMPGVVAATDKQSSDFLLETPENSYILAEPIGNSSFNSDNIAAWNVGFLKAPLDSASGSWTGASEEIPTTFIPQLNCDVKYQFNLYPPSDKLSGDIINKTITVMEGGIGDDPDEDLVIFGDDSFAVFEKDYALLKVEEDNTQFVKDNLELEVYRILVEAFKETKPDGTVVYHPEVKEKLYFTDEYASNVEDTKLVEYYFDIATDFDIDQQEYCRLRKQKEHIKDIYIDQIFECEEKKSTLQSLNIYNTDENIDIEGVCD